MSLWCSEKQSLVVCCFSLSHGVCWGAESLEAFLWVRSVLVLGFCSLWCTVNCSKPDSGWCCEMWWRNTCQVATLSTSCNQGLGVSSSFANFQTVVQCAVNLSSVRIHVTIHLLKLYKSVRVCVYTCVYYIILYIIMVCKYLDEKKK